MDTEEMKRVWDDHGKKLIDAANYALKAIAIMAEADEFLKDDEEMYALYSVRANVARAMGQPGRELMKIRRDFAAKRRMVKDDETDLL